MQRPESRSLLRTSLAFGAFQNRRNTPAETAGSEHWSPLSFLIAASISRDAIAATILKFLQDGRHSSLVACFAQFVHDRLRCNKS